MRCKLDSNGVVTDAGDHLTEPSVIFPVNWPAETFIGLQTVVGLSGLRLLIDDNQVVAREDNAKIMPGGSSPSAELVAAAVQNYMAANPPIAGPKGDRGESGPVGNVGPQGDRGVQGPKGDPGAQGVAGTTGSQGVKGDTGATGPAGPAGPAVLRTSYPQAVTLLLGIPQDVTFTWSTPFDNASYNHDVAVAPALLGKVSITVKSKTAAALTVTLTAVLGVAGGVGAVAWA